MEGVTARLTDTQSGGHICHPGIPRNVKIVKKREMIGRVRIITILLGHMKTIYQFNTNRQFFNDHTRRKHS